MNISGLERHLVVMLSMRFQMIQYESYGILDFCSFSIILFHVTKHNFICVTNDIRKKCFTEIKSHHTNLLVAHRVTLFID